MRILFVHEVNYRRKVVYEMHDLPELLSLRGHHVTFIDYPEGEDRRGWRRLLDLKTEEQVQSRAHPGSSVIVQTPGRVLPPPLDRLAASLTQVPVINRALRRDKFDAVVLYGVPTNGWQTIGLARRHRVPVLFRALDVSHRLRPSYFAPMIRLAERYIYRHANAISANNVALQRYVIRAGANPAVVTVEYPGLDLTRFVPGPKPASLLARYALQPSDRVILFMGTLYRFAGLDWFIDHFAETLRANDDIRLLLLGGGEAEPMLRHKVRALGLECSVIFTGFIEYSELASHLLLGDIAINPFAEELVTNCALPSKVLQYAGCGLPTVCTRLEGMMGLLAEGEGITYRPAGAEFIAALLDWLSDDRAREEAAAQARRSIESRCQWEVSIAALEQAIERVVRP